MRYLLAVVLLLVGAPAMADSPEPLTLTPNPVDFGSVAVGESSVRTVRAVNASSADVTVASVTASGASVTSSTCPGAVLQPTQSCEIVLAWRPMQAGSLTGSLTVQSDAGAVTVDLSGVAVSPPPDVTLSVKGHSKSLHVRKHASLISKIQSSGNSVSARAWCTYLGKPLPKKFAKKACGLTTSGRGKKYRASARPLCTKDVTLEARVVATQGTRSATWKRTWRVFVQPHAGYRPSEPICATMGERFG